MNTVVFKVHGFTALISVTLMALLTTSIPTPLVQEDLLREIELIMKDLEYLHSRGVDVGLVIDLLNKAISEYSSGSIEKAREYLEEAKRRVESLKMEAESTYIKIIAIKAVTVASLASIPPLIYFILPRLYLYLWFKLHRKWIVR